MEDNRYAYKELYYKELNEKEKIKDELEILKAELEILKAEINTTKWKNESLPDSPASLNNTDEHYEHVRMLGAYNHIHS